MENKIAIYTVNIGGYDDFKEPKIVPKNVDFIYITDDKTLTSKIWKFKYVEREEHATIQQRRIKILFNEYIPEYNRVIYIDANLELLKDITKLITRPKNGMLAMLHPTRKCIYKEGLAIIEAQKATKEEINSQISKYFSEGISPESGLYDTKFLYRENTPEVINICEQWWEELSKESHRDQLSFPVILERNKFTPGVISRATFNPYIKYHSHKVMEVPIVHYISPFRSDKDIGKANNIEIGKYPTSDWVCITDADAMPLLPDYGTQIEQIIMRYGHEYGLIGCLTNRLGGVHQCYNNEISTDFDIRKHYEIAKEVKEEYGNKVEETSGVSGLCMIFKVETWRRVGGFREGTPRADTEFNKAVKHKGLKIGIAKGLYFFHCYRIWEGDETDPMKLRKSEHHLK